MKLQLLGLFLCSATFASDLFMPIAPNSIQIGAGLEYESVQRTYDADGKSTDLEESDGNGSFRRTTQLAPRVTFGAAPNIDVTLTLPYKTYNGENRWNEWDGSGFDRPVITGKYGISDIGIAGFLNLFLPFGSDEVTGEDPILETSFGVLMDRMMENIQLRGDITYYWAREQNNYDPANTISLHLRPGFKFIPNLIGELDLGYSMKGQDSRDGSDVRGSEKSKLDLAPGLLYQAGPTTKFELLLPFTFSGENVEGTWGISILVLHQI